MAKYNIGDWLKEWSAATGLYGDDLKKAIDMKLGIIPEAAKENKTFTDLKEERREFIGSRQEFWDYLKLLGDTTDDKWCGALSPTALCVNAARLLGIRQFSWVRPIEKKQKDGSYVLDIDVETVFLDKHGNLIVT